MTARILATTIDLDDGTCSLDLVESAAGYYGLSLAKARTIIREVAEATSTWRSVASIVGARAGEITWIASAFEHDDLARATVL